jgi:hypothetical protein
VIARAEKDLYREELLYWYLIDLLRSPEVVKGLSGSIIKFINNRDEKIRRKKLKED